MLGILTNLARLAGMQAVIALAAIARNKVLAIRLGPEGYGEFIQLTLFVIAASTVASFGMGMALNRNAAAHPDKGDRQRLLGQANGVNVLASLVLIGATALLVLLRPETLGLIGLEGEPRIVGSLLLMLAVIPVDAAMQHRIGFLIGIEDIKGMTAGRSAALIAGTVLSIPLVWYFGLIGATIQLVLQSLLVVVLLDRRCRTLGYRAWALVFDAAVFKSLARLGAASIVAGTAMQLSDLTTRTILVRARDVGEGGIYQAALSLSHQVRAVVLGSVGSYLIAKLSQNQDRDVISATANQLLSLIQPIALVAFGFLGLLAGPVIVLLYSDAFLAAQSVLSWLLMAYFVQVMIWVIGAPLLSLDRVGVWLGLELTFAAARLVLALPFVAEYGMHAVAGAYLAATGVHLLLNFLYVYRVLKLKIEVRQIVIMVIGAISIWVVAAIGRTADFGIQEVLMGASVLVVVTLGLIQWLFGVPRAWQSLRGVLKRGNENA